MNILYLVGILILGILIGFLVNYLADVLPFARRLTNPVCVHCQKDLDWKHFFFLKNCPHCHRDNRKRKYLVILLLVSISLFCWITPPVKVNYWIFMTTIVYLGVVAIIDFEYRAILHQMSLFGLILGLITGILTFGIKSTLLGGFAGFLIMLSLYWLGELFSKLLSKIRKQDIGEVALGFGDVSLSGILGLMLGWPLILVCLLAAIILGGIISGGIILYMAVKREYKPFTAIPYAPFLIIAGIVLLYLHK